MCYRRNQTIEEPFNCLEQQTFTNIHRHSQIHHINKFEVWKSSVLSLNSIEGFFEIKNKQNQITTLIYYVLERFI